MSSNKFFLIVSLVFLISVFGTDKFVFSQGLPVEIMDETESICSFNNTKMAILSVVKNITGIPASGILPTFYYNTMPTPLVLPVKIDQTVDENNYKYTGRDAMLLDPGEYKILETIPSDLNWLMRDANCSILPVCGDRVCDTSTEVGETCSSCQFDCGPCSLSSLPPPPLADSEPTGGRISGKNGLENVQFIVGRTTECVFDNELISLKIVSEVIGGDGTETFDYNIKRYDPNSPSMEFGSLSVVTDQKIREDKIRGNEWSGSNGKYLKPAITSYTITEEISDGWALNSVVCELQSGRRTGVPTIYNYGVVNVTIEPDKVTTCTFTKTKKGDIKIVKNASGAEGREEFNYDISFNSTDYLEQSGLQASGREKKVTIKVDENGLGSFLFLKFVAVSSSGEENRIMKSDDGNNWVILESPKNREGDYVDSNWQSLVYGGGLLVAVADGPTGNRIMTSRDGINWDLRESPKDKDGNYVDNNWQSVTYGNGMFVAVASSGSGNRIMTSRDGINWDLRESPKDKDGNYVDNNWQSVTYGNGMFVAVSESGTKNRIMTSFNGVTWIIRESPKDKNENYVDNNWQSVTYGNGMFVAVASSGSGNRVMTSKDGINWFVRKSASNNDWQSVTYGKKMFVAVSSSGSTNRIMASKDGINWESKTSPVNNDWQSVTYGKGILVAVSSNGSGNRIMTSNNGINWDLRESPKDKDGNYVDNNWQSVSHYNSGLYPGSYKIIEILPKDSSLKNFWRLSSVKCVLENGEQTGKNTLNGLDDVKVFAGQTTTCTFDNTSL